MRAWVLGQGLDPNCGDEWWVAGERFLDAVKRKWQVPEGTKEEDKGYRFETMDSAFFFAASFKLQWLIKRLLVMNQPCVFGGPKKLQHKTTLLMDLAISLATASAVPRPFRRFTAAAAL